MLLFWIDEVMKTIKKYRKYNFKGQSITKNNKATEKIKPIEKAEGRK